LCPPSTALLIARFIRAYACCTLLRG
jgi:hypothetical protein